jgi:hypothetical protein
MDPALVASRVPASQTWAIELLAGEASGLSEHDVRASAVRGAGAALSAPRGPLVQRRLSGLRHQLRDGDLSPRAAALGVLDVVASEGLRRVDDADRGSGRVAITRDRVRLICFQVIGN